MSFLKGAVIFTSGVIVGGAGSFLYFRKKSEEQKEELKELKEHYLGKIAEEAETERYKQEHKTIVKEQHYISYENPTILEEPDVKNYPDEPFIIDEIEYSERELYFDKVELDYYVEDEVCVDESEEITDINTTVGYDVIDDFKNDESEDVIYVRNTKLNTDYMINKRFGKYSDIVGLGGDSDDD